MGKILVVAAHPDDEILGAGATIAKKVKEGDTAYALILAEGQTSRWDTRNAADQKAVDLLHKDACDAAQIIGYKEIFWGDFPDNRMDACDLLDIVKCVESHVRRIEPDVVYTHHAGDLNIDHQLAAKAVSTATRPIGNYSVKRLYAFQTVSSTEWNFGSRNECFFPNVFEDIDQYFEKKCEAMRKYASELCEFPHPRSIKMLEAVSEYWGSTVGLKRAEAFELIREVIA